MRTHLQTHFLGKKTNYIFMWLSLLLLLATSANAQYISGYTFSASVGPYTPITTGTVLGSGAIDDVEYLNNDIGFPFFYNGTVQNKFSLSSNGLLSFGPTLSAWGLDGSKNSVTAMSEDLMGQTNGEIRFDTLGTAPFRRLVVQFKNWSFYHWSGTPPNDTMNFQIILYETTNIVEFRYNITYFTGGDENVLVGITGSNTSEFANRTTALDWSATTSGVYVYDPCLLSATGPVLPASGLRYTYTPPPKVYNSSIVEAGPSLGVGPGAVSQIVGKLTVAVDGFGAYLPTSSITVNTTGTTNLADITNLKVYYTGGSSVFSTATQFGTTVSSPAASNTITDSINLTTGNNYFWITYDISAGATLGNFVDASVSDLLVGNVLRTPTVTSPAGNREISSPMTYVTSFAETAKLNSMGQGTENNEILKMVVVTSSTGSPVDITQFDLSALGTTDTADIRNLKVWYTGSTNAFSATTQFGSTLAYLPGALTFAITGSQSLENDTNYFWLTADINEAATIANVVDAEWSTVTFDATPQTPTTTAPAGSRAIRADYCDPIISNASNSCNWGYYISAVSTSGATGNLSNTSGCNGNANNYINITNETLTIKPTETVTINLGDYTSWITYTVWIDYNQDGIFDNGTERVFQHSGQNEGFVSGTFTVPCSALTGTTRMRIRGGDWYWWGAPIGDPCSDMGYGETEDYNVVVLPNPVVYVASTAIQQTGSTFPGSTDRKVLRVPVLVAGCGVGVVNGFTFSTTGTTSAANITNAKLYRTGSSEAFSNTHLLGTVASPSGQFSFTVADTLIENGVTNYWLAYDISASATISNVIDATFDSASIIGAYHTPIDVNPSGNIEILTPMTYIGSEAFHQNIFKAAKGSSDNEVLGVSVIMSSSGATKDLTEMTFSANGTTDTAEISNIRVWYTGNTSTFSTATPFGAALDKLPGTLTFTITGLQPLYNDTNYFWLTYDVDAGAVVGNEIDGECTSIIIDGVPEVPGVTAPLGSRQIREEYCVPQMSNAQWSCGWNETVDFNTSGAIGNITNNNSGCMGTANNYTYYPNHTLTIAQNATFTFNLNTGGSQQSIAIWIDYDKDGVYNNTNERVFVSANDASSFSGSITISCDGLPGPTRMRVRNGVTWWTGSPVTDPCSDYGYGETEDYNVVIISNPVAFQSTDAVQSTGVVAPGAVDRKVLQLPVTNTGCGIAVVNEFVLNTAGTTSASDITNAKLYSTGLSSTFNTSNLRATVSSPSGSFTFMISDTIESNGTTYYWLAYDISASATLSNVIDARFDSVLVLNNYETPANANPSGNITVASPMVYIGSTTTQNMLQSVPRGTSDNQVLGVQIIMSSTGAAVNLTQLDFDATGTTDTADLRDIKVWYTGNSSTFATTTQFGSSLSDLPGTMAFSIAGTQALENDTNYFWLTYDIDGSAALGNQIDGECSSITIDGMPQTPSLTAPAGSREIREEYCIPQLSQAQWSCNWYEIVDFNTSGATVDISNNNSGCMGASNNYTYYNNQVLTVAQNGTFTFNLNTGGSSQSIGIWIDYDQNGIYNNTNEFVYLTPTSSNSVSGSITIPCSGLPGETRMRVRSGVEWWTGFPVNNPCSDYGYGETEDYKVIITSNPIAFGSTSAIQMTTPTFAGALNKAVLHVPITTSGCGDLALSNIHFSTTGTTAVSDILNAKLYRTGSSTSFNTNTLLGTVSAPNGAFNFAVVDTLIANATTNYWLAYDIDGAATNGNFIDAVFDSVEVNGNYELPTVTNPAGHIQITTPLAYIGSTVSQDVLSKVGAGSADNQMLKIQVFMSSTGASVPLTELSFNALGTTDTADIRDIRVWYTGNSPAMSFSNQFGSTLPALPGSIGFSVNGLQELMPDTNYFWLTYSINSSATLGNVVDAECGSITVNATTQTPSVTAPAGVRVIRTEYCSPSHGTSLYACIFDASFNTMTNPTGGCGTIPNYTNFPQTGAFTTEVFRGGEYILSVMTDYNGASISAWFDWNDDGTFAASEWYDLSRNTTGNTTYVYNVTIPNTASLGSIRVRLRTRASTANTSTDACTTFGSGETEDYTITINPTPPQTTYVWNQTSPADYSVASNWTPARTAPFVNDVLVFNGGGSLQVNNVTTQKVGSILLLDSTHLMLGSSGAVTLSVADTLDLTTGSITENNVTVSIGADTTNIGLILGNGKITGGAIRRWVNTSVTSYDFPLANGSSDNSANITFTAPPTGGTITARFFSSDPASNSGLPLTEGSINVDKVSPFGYWRFTSANGFVNGQHTLTLNADGIGFVNTAAELVMVRRANNIGIWSLEGTHVTTTGTNAFPILSRTGVATLGEFAVAGDATVNPLPVQLVSLKANALKGDVLLNWATASELNNNGFDVERSADGQTFSKVGFVKGKGNSNVLVNYTLTDRNAFTAAKVSTLYYRLRQVDNDGTAKYTNIVKVTDTKNVLSGVAVYPNPFNQNVSIDFVTSQAAAYTVTINDIQGRTVYSKQMDAKEGLNSIMIEQLSTLQSGVYFLKLNGPETQTIKLVKTH